MKMVQIKFTMLSPKEFSNFILSNGDIIDIPRDDGIMVNGFVQNQAHMLMSRIFSL